MNRSFFSEPLVVFGLYRRDKPGGSLKRFLTGRAS